MEERTMSASGLEVFDTTLQEMGQCLDRGELAKLRRHLPYEALNLWPEDLLR